MDLTSIIKQKLPEDLWEIAINFDIPEKHLNEDPNLIIMILKSKSIDKKEEKQSWLNLLSIMNDEQIKKLSDILLREKDKFEEIDNRYEKKKDAVKKKYEGNFESMAYQNKMMLIKQTEGVHREKEKEEADNLLDNM